MSKYFYDTEFLEDGKTIELISIGIVSDDGREYYAVNNDAPWMRIGGNEWLMKNVVPSLPTVKSAQARTLADALKIRGGSLVIDRKHEAVKPQWVIANEVRAFLLAQDGGPELWAWCAAYDHVKLAQLYGPMITMPKGLPHKTHDIETLMLLKGVGDNDLPKQADGQHNALEDARHVKTMYDYITQGSKS